MDIGGDLAPFEKLALSEDEKKDLIERSFKTYGQELIKEIMTEINLMVKEQVSLITYKEINVEISLANIPQIKGNKLMVFLKAIFYTSLRYQTFEDYN